MRRLEGRDLLPRELSTPLAVANDLLDPSIANRTSLTASTAEENTAGMAMGNDEVVSNGTLSDVRCVRCLSVDGCMTLFINYSHRVR